MPIRNGDHITFGNDFSDLVYAFHTVEPRCPPGRRSPRDPRRTSGGSSGSDASPAGAKPKLPGPPPASPPHTPPHPHSPGHSPGHSPAAHDGPPHGRGGYRASPPRAEPAPGGRRGSMGHFSDDDAMELRLVDPHARAAACAPRVIPLNKAQVRVGSADHREPVDVVLRSGAGLWGGGGGRGHGGRGAIDHCSPPPPLPRGMRGGGWSPRDHCRECVSTGA